MLSFTHDVIMAGISLILSIYLRLGSSMFAYAGWDLAWWLLTFCGIAAICFRLFGMNTGIWRYASISDLVAIARAATLTILLFLLVSFLWTRLEALPRSVPVINWFVLVVLLGAPRILYRLLKDRRISGLLHGADTARTPVVLVGAGDGTELFIRAMLTNPRAQYLVVGIIDEKGGRVGRSIRDVEVLGMLAETDQIIDRLTRRGLRPRTLILTKPMDGSLVRQMVRLGEKHGIEVARLPELSKLRSKLDDEPPQPKPIAIEDLLGRPPITLDRNAIGQLLSDKTVVVTGAGGSIGSEICRQVAAHAPKRMILVETSEYGLYSIDLDLSEKFPGIEVRPVICDVRDRNGIKRLFQIERPDVVFHAAALKHVPLVEFNPCEGTRTNAIGTRNVADAALDSGVRAMVLISTDKAVNPTNVMGATKRIAESYCQALDIQEGDRHSVTRFMTVRFGNVLGSSGSVVPLFQRQLAAGGPLTVTHPDIRRYFMTVQEAVQLVLQASAYGMRTGGERGKIFVLDMGEPVQILDLANQVIRLSGFRPGEDVKVVFTGLRPGEKLFEELFDVAEPPSPTPAEGVLAASPRPVDVTLLRRMMTEIETAALAGDDQRVLSLLATAVPEFRHAPNGSDLLPEKRTREAAS
ncbi:MAG TPA: nucleoside-diphosphate sugar epimerase/dehydratase [Arenibaculum sp.]|nr:nucleoside-diphosphate sugar epimerase/dehydratase [Arenibaculum sp.]